jgi:hypothetical protein
MKNEYEALENTRKDGVTKYEKWAFFYKQNVDAEVEGCRCYASKGVRSRQRGVIMRDRERYGANGIPARQKNGMKVGAELIPHRES